LFLGFCILGRFPCLFFIPSGIFSFSSIPPISFPLVFFVIQFPIVVLNMLFFPLNFPPFSRFPSKFFIQFPQIPAFLLGDRGCFGKPPFLFFFKPPPNLLEEPPPLPPPFFGCRAPPPLTFQFFPEKPPGPVTLYLLVLKPLSYGGGGCFEPLTSSNTDSPCSFLSHTKATLCVKLLILLVVVFLSSIICPAPTCPTLSIFSLVFFVCQTYHPFPFSHSQPPPCPMVVTPRRRGTVVPPPWFFGVV